MPNYNRRQFLALTGGGIVAACVTAACGDDGDGDENGSPTAQATAPAGDPSPIVSAGADNGAAGLRWFGQSMFLLTSPGDTTVVLDPFNDIGYPVPPPLDTDAATITHEHLDHNNEVLAGSTAQVLRGLTDDGWADIDQQVGDVRVRVVQSFHDASQGSERGRNAIFVFETGGLRVVHLGDLGHDLTDSQVDALGGSIDALMIPVGGSFTIGADIATAIVERLQPALVFPMHYGTDAIALPLDPVDVFLEGKQAQRVGSTDMRLSRDTLPETPIVMVLDYA